MARRKAQAARTKRPSRRTRSKRKATGPRRRKGRLWRVLGKLFAGVLLVGLIVAIAIGAYLVVLDREITGRFEGRRWSLPARVYAAPMALYAGLRSTPDELAMELRRLGYRETTGSHPAVGRYVVGPYRVRATLRPFHFADARRSTLPVTIDFGAGRIVEVTGPHGPLSYVRLEPAIIGSFFPSHGEDRLVVAPDETPALLVETLKAVEDRNFDTHPGFDIRGILRAVWANVRAGEIAQGGSTLTQQLVRSYYLDNRPTLTRKLNEVAMAVILDARFEKADLMNAYVNEIFLGQDGARAIHGFGLGSFFYFNKPLLELDAHEIALLVAVINGPSFYNPFRHPERAKGRRDLVLNTMRDLELIGQRLFEDAVARPLAVARNRSGGRYYPAFMDLVRIELAKDYDRKTLSAEGLAIHTTLDPRVQERAEQAVVTTLATIERDRQLPEDTLEAAVVVRASQTGDIKAVVGGRLPGRQGFNRALNAKRQVGSLIKPFVYLAAIESGRYHLASPVEDTELTLPEFDDWTPTNANDEYRGTVPLVHALAESLNVATVRVGMDLGVAGIAERIAELNDNVPTAYPSLLLGAYDASPYEMSEAYAMLAGGGFKTPAKTVTAVIDAFGGTVKRYPIDVKQVADPVAISTLTRALQVAMSRGTGKRSPLARSGVAGKTGSSDDFRDSWYAGYDADTLTVVWVGLDDNNSHGLSGSRGALVVWDAFMADTDVEPALTGDAQNVAIDYDTGLRARPGCGDVVEVPLPAGTELRWKPGCRPLRDRVRAIFD